MNEQSIITILVGVCGALIAAVCFMAWSRMERSDNRSDVRDMRDEGRDRDHRSANERFQDRYVDAAVDLSKLDANVTLLMSERGKCDELAKDVAILTDFKTRADAKFDDVDEARRGFAAMTEQIRTLFKAVEDLPDTVTNRVLASVPRVVKDTLEAARAAPQQRAANG